MSTTGKIAALARCLHYPQRLSHYRTFSHYHRIPSRNLARPNISLSRTMQSCNHSFGILTMYRQKSTTTFDKDGLASVETTSDTGNVDSFGQSLLENSANSSPDTLSDKLTSSMFIPEPPDIPNVFQEAASKIVLNSAGEPTFESIGLGGWTPSGIVQQCLEYFHVSLGLPWWGAIMTGTLIVRLLVFPLVLKSQRNAAKMRNHLPGMQRLQLKITEAKQTGDQLMAAKYSNDLMIFMKEKDINPLKSMMVPIAMAPVFVSFFFGLRKMANLPVESLRTGGLFWFTDLTIADPFYILPLLTSVTLWVTLEIGADGVSTGSQGGLMKYVIRGFPVILFPMMMNFPAALLCYWVSTNLISLTQVSLLKIPALREKFKIDSIVVYNKEDLPVQNKGFVESAKDSWANVKVTRQMQDRERYDEISFKRAGRGPLPKTFKYDPTKIQAKPKQNN